MGCDFQHRVAGLENETECTAQLTYAAWVADTAHPRTWTHPASLTAHLFDSSMKSPRWTQPGECRPAAAAASAAAAWRMRPNMTAASAPAPSGAAAARHRALLRVDGAVTSNRDAEPGWRQRMAAAMHFLGYMRQTSRQMGPGVAAKQHVGGRLLLQAVRSRYVEALTANAVHDDTVAERLVPAAAEAVPHAQQGSAEAARVAAAERRKANIDRLARLQNRHYSGPSVHYAPNDTDPVELEDVARWAANFEALPASCPLFARKFAASTAAAVEQLYRQHLSVG